MTRWKQRVLLFAIAVLLIAPIGHAQTSSPIRMSMPVMSFPGGDRSTIRITVTELGPSETSSRVRIRLLDETERPFTGGTAEGDLRHGSPVRLDFRLGAFSGRVMQAGAAIDIDRADGAMPVVVLEHIHHEIDPIDTKIATRIICGPPGKIMDPVSPSLPPDGHLPLLIGGGCASFIVTPD
jgi:hypothetical protein